MTEMLGVDVDVFGFCGLDDAEVAPVQSSVPRVFLAGTGLAPRDIPEAVVQVPEAVAKALSMFKAAEVEEMRREGSPLLPSDGKSGAREAAPLTATEAA